MLTLALQSYQMFYALSKALFFLIQPPFWLIVLLIIALFTKRRKTKRRASLAAVLLYFILGNPWLYTQAIEAIEWPRSELRQDHYDYAIILGGYGEYNRQKSGLELNKAADRLMAAIELYHQGIVDRVILSSGVAPDDNTSATEASISKEALLDAGIPAADILLEEQSWNTHENAVYTAELIQASRSDASSLLVTSAFHMDRALQCFAKEGLSPEAYPVDYISGTEACRGLGCILPSIRVFIDWQILIKEKVGLLVYGMRGFV